MTRLKVGLCIAATSLASALLGAAAVLVTDARIDLTSPRNTGTAESAPTEQPKDRVVNVMRVCEAATKADGRPFPIEVLGGCEGADAIMKVNDHLEVTVRTATGGSYTISVPVTKKVRVGQEWP